MNTKFIALSGIDGAGKSTQLNLLKESLENSGGTVLCLWTRGGNTPGSNAVKAFIRRMAGNSLPPSGHSSKRDDMLQKDWIQRVWLVLAILDLIRIYGVLVRCWVFRGKLIICDRYLWDTLIDFKIMFPKIDIENWFLWKLLVWCTPVPDKSILLIIPLHLSEKRCLQKYEPFPDTPERRKKRYEHYENAANNTYWDIIDSTRSVESVFSDITSDS
jgi:thymidylate kinase